MEKRVKKTDRAKMIRITWIYKNKYIETNLPLRKISGPHGDFDYYPVVWVDGKNLNDSEIELLSLKSGFKSINDFFYFYNKDFSGDIPIPAF